MCCVYVQCWRLHVSCFFWTFSPDFFCLMHLIQEAKRQAQPLLWDPHPYLYTLYSRIWQQDISAVEWSFSKCEQWLKAAHVTASKNSGLSFYISTLLVSFSHAHYKIHPPVSKIPLHSSKQHGVTCQQTCCHSPTHSIELFSFALQFSILVFTPFIQPSLRNIK